MTTTYSGWSNYDTWNVVLHFQNDFDLYWGTVRYLKTTKNPTYQGLVEFVGLAGCMTVDKVAFLSPNLDHDELDQWLGVFANEIENEGASY
jgi:hypothetical protein